MDKFLLIAHRGGLYYRPENTVAAFQYSIGAGIPWAECDVRLSSDNVPVLHHDERIATPGSGLVLLRELNSGELREIDVGGGETVPALASIFTQFRGKVKFDLEIKELDVLERVAPMLDRYHRPNAVIITSFIPEALQIAAELIPDIPRGLLVDRLTGVIAGSKGAVKSAGLLGCRFVLPQIQLASADWVRHAISDRLIVIPWTVNRREDARRLIDWGVGGIISDRPDHLKPVCDDLLQST